MSCVAQRSLSVSWVLARVKARSPLERIRKRTAFLGLTLLVTSTSKHHGHCHTKEHYHIPKSSQSAVGGRRKGEGRGSRSSHSTSHTLCVCVCFAARIPGWDTRAASAALNLFPVKLLSGFLFVSRRPISMHREESNPDAARIPDLKRQAVLGPTQEGGEDGVRLGREYSQIMVTYLLQNTHAGD